MRARVHRSCRQEPCGEGGGCRWVRLLGASLAVAVAGCATSADPHEGGFISGVVGITGGGYQRRLEERKDSYQDAQDAQERLEAQARALEQERAAVRADLERAWGRLAAQERRIAAERARIAALRDATAVSQARLESLSQAQSRIDTAKGSVRSARREEHSVEDLRARAQSISTELDEIDNMVGAVSGT